MERLGVCGHGVRVEHLCPIEESSTLAAPAVTAMTTCRSIWITEKARKDSKLVSQCHGTVSSHSESSTKLTNSH
jgi:hypothetical protein